MKGESIEGMSTCDDSQGDGLSQQDSTFVKSPVTPPLSAAASQVSLAQSDLTTSDPDITASSTNSSRPPSSTNDDLSTRDLDLGVMKGESIEGMSTCDDIREHGLSREDATFVKSTVTPPLSAAESQVSLAPSDLNTSDPDLAGSSAYSSTMSSRPPSSTQTSLNNDELVTSDLDLTATATPVSSAPSSRPPSASDFHTPDQTLSIPREYTPETVEFPTSPLALKSAGDKVGGVCLAEAEDSKHTPLTYSPGSTFLSPPEYKTVVESSGDGFEVSSDLEEEYFEEFHLPNSHENAFVRHKSFRRKVNLTPINAPDAEKIEGLVRTGEFIRHGSMRRKIVPEESTIPETDNETCADSENTVENRNNESLSSVTETFSKDLKEIVNMLNESDGEEEISDIVLNDTHATLDDEISNQLQTGVQQTNTSTPKTNHTKNTSKQQGNDLSLSLAEISEESLSLSIEQSTLMKVRECMDVTKVRDLYNLSGRLQDILTPKEVEEILNNSDRYIDYVDQEVIEALHNSLQDQGTTYNTRTTDSGICSTAVITTESIDLNNTSKDNTGQGEIEDENVKRSSDGFVQVDDIELHNDTGFRLERRRSKRFDKRGKEELEIVGVFVESNSQDLGMKRIPAPPLDLSGIASEDLNDVPDLSSSEIPESTDVSPIMTEERNLQSHKVRPLNVPDIVVISACDNDDEANHRKLLFEGSDLSSMTSPTTPMFDITPASPDLTFDDEFYDPSKVERPKQLDFGNICQRKRISVAEDILRSPVEGDNISISAFSQHSDGDEDQNGDERQDVFETRCEDLEVRRNEVHERLPTPPPFIPELSATEETSEERHWRSIVIGGVWRRIDMKAIAPYRKCVSHGGHLEDSQNAVIVFSASRLPDKSRKDYDYVMDNLFLYVLSTLEQLIADEYVLVYLAGGTPKSHMPNFHWLKRAYQMIDRKLRKNLQALHVVHPTFWVRAVVAFSRPFISSKFYRKLRFVSNLTELAQMVPLDQLDIPDAVKQADFELMISEKKKNLNRRMSSSSSLVAR